jgi:hypothetical protein
VHEHKEGLGRKVVRIAVVVVHTEVVRIAVVDHMATVVVADHIAVAVRMVLGLAVVRTAAAAAVQGSLIEDTEAVVQEEGEQVYCSQTDLVDRVNVAAAKGLVIVDMANVVKAAAVLAT